MQSYTKILPILIILFFTSYSLQAQDSEIEKWFLEQLSKGGIVDFSKCPNGNKISNADLNNALATIMFSSPTGVNLTIQNANFTDHLSINYNYNATLLFFEKCIFEADVDVTNSEIKGGLVFDNCKLNDLNFFYCTVKNLDFHLSTIKKAYIRSSTIELCEFLRDTIRDSVEIGNTTIIGNLQITKNFFYGGIALLNDNLKSELCFTENHFLHSVAIGNIAIDENTSFIKNSFQNTLICKSIDTKGDVEFRNNDFNSGVEVENLETSKSLIFFRNNFNDESYFDNSRIGLNLLITFCNFRKSDKMTSFRFSTIKGDISLASTQFHGTTLFTRTTVEQNFDISDCNFYNTSDFTNCSVLTDFSVDHSTFSKPLYLYETKIGLSLLLGRSTFTDTTTNIVLSSSVIGNSLSLVKSKFSGNVLAEGLKIGTQITLDSSDFYKRNGLISFNSSIISGNGFFGFHSTVNGSLNLGYLKANAYVELHNCNINEADFHDMDAGNKLKLDTITFNNLLSLDNVKTNVLTLECFNYPNKEKKGAEEKGVKLEGLTYKNLIIGKEGNVDSLKLFLKLLEIAPFSRSSYIQFADFLTSHDLGGFSDEVYIAMKRREGGFWNGFLKLFVGNGRHPYYAFLWSLAFIVIGGTCFKKEKMMAINSTRIPYNRWWYSFGLFIPIIKTETHLHWTPNPNFWCLRIYFRIHSLIGYILIPLGIAGVSGLIK